MSETLEALNANTLTRKKTERYIIKFRTDTVDLYWTQRSYGFSSVFLNVHIDESAIFESKSSAKKRIVDIKNRMKDSNDEFFKKITSVVEVKIELREVE